MLRTISIARQVRLKSRVNAPALVGGAQQTRTYTSFVERPVQVPCGFISADEDPVWKENDSWSFWFKSLFMFKPGCTPWYFSARTAVSGTPGYRTPSPGDQYEGVRLPMHETDDDIYNTNIYYRDSTKEHFFQTSAEVWLKYDEDNVGVPHVKNWQGEWVPMESHVYGENAPRLQQERIDAGEEPLNRSSAGTKNPDVLRYDPTGLRSTPTANWDAWAKEMEKEKPTHLPQGGWINPWDKDYPKIVEYYKKQGKPVPIGHAPFTVEPPSIEEQNAW